MDSILEIHTFGPLLLRDGRPFAGGNEESRAQSLSVPLPSTLAGFVRTQVGNANGWKWKDMPDKELHDKLDILHGIPVRSLLCRDNTLMFPAPQNAIVDKDGKIYCLTPKALGDNEGCNFPESSDFLKPLAMNPEPDDTFKADGGYLYWPTDALKAWLLGKIPGTLEKIAGLPTEERVHIEMDSEKGSGVEGHLFSVTYRSFEECTSTKPDPDKKLPKLYHRWTLRVKTDVPDKLPKIGVGHLGGERRAVALSKLNNTSDAPAWWDISQCKELRDALVNENNNRLCFILTSPALFEEGWKPAWLTQSLGSQTPKGVTVLLDKVELVGAAVGRRIPISGWNVRTQKPKPVRWAVPAGSVYFLQVKEGYTLSKSDREKLLEAWLKPLSDTQNDQRDGFGCAVWGVW